MLLSQLLKNIKVYETNGEIDGINVEHLTLDNRKCREGSVFFAIKGLVTDGHKYIGGAAQNGAVAAFVEEFTCDDILQIKVRDTRSAMSLIAAAFYGNPAKKLDFIGVTGTNGKTSITYMLKKAMQLQNKSVAVIGTSGIYANDEKLNIEISTSTTPDPIELQYILSVLVEKGVQIVLMEVTAQALHLRKVEDITYKAGIFTNFTQDHLEFFGTMEVYASAKKKLFLPGRCNCAVINIDDALGDEISSGYCGEMLTYSLKANADLFAKQVEINGQTSSFVLVYKKKEYPVKLNITGEFNIYNALGSIGALLSCGVDVLSAIAYLGAYTGTPGRFETPDMQGADYSVVIDYAHTPDGLENILKAVNEYKKGRIFTVFGCGGDRDSVKRPIMGAIAAKYSDFCVITSDNPRFEEPMDIIDQIAKGLPEGHQQHILMENRYSAIKYAMQNAKKDDIIVIAGKGDEDYQDIKGTKHHFSDREAVAEILKILQKK